MQGFFAAIIILLVVFAALAPEKHDGFDKPR